MNRTTKDTSLYETLGVSPTAEIDEIKKVFRKLALKCHPDKLVNASDEEKKEAEATFKKITEAYTILSDPEKREKYDRFGLDAFNNGNGNDGGFEMNEDLHEMLRSMGGFGRGGMGGFGMGGFGMGGMGGMGGQRGKKREIVIPNVISSINLDMKEIFIGSEKEFEIERYNLKKDADPKKEDIICNECKGVGIRVVITKTGTMTRQTQQQCDKCNGKGIIFPEEFFEKKTQKFSKIIPQGIMNGGRIEINNKGHEIPPCFRDMHPANNNRTNIILVVNENKVCEIEKSQYKYIRGANNSYSNILLEIEIEPHEAICGTYKYIPFIDGKNICIKIPQGIFFTKDSNAVVIPGMGMPVYEQSDKRGDLYVMMGINNATAKIEESKLKQIWKILTGKDMTSETNKILKSAGGEFIEAITLEESSKYNLDNDNDHDHDNGNGTDHHMHNDNDNDNANGHHQSHYEHYEQQNMGSPVQCAQQ